MMDGGQVEETLGGGAPTFLRLRQLQMIGPERRFLCRPEVEQRTVAQRCGGIFWCFSKKKFLEAVRKVGET